MSEVFSVFLSWQSDTARRHGRDLIREALDLAADAVSRDTTVPYGILVQSDTENEPGMCNIPETILRRLRESDAIIFDLTFVAITDAPEPKHCSNPNVLFELGYAFAKIGPERLICVMNEFHGPTANQIFDLAHHRRPISFRSPCENTTRAKTVEALAHSLESALREVTKLGLIGGFGGDDEILHQRQLSDIQSFWQSADRHPTRNPRIAIWFRPKLFRPKRWADSEAIESLLRKIGPLTSRSERYPPQPMGNAPMDWGLYNDTYGDPWTLTYAGQFWTEISVAGHHDLRLYDRDLRLSPEPPHSNVLGSGEWVRANYSLSEIGTVFKLLRNLAQQCSEAEIVQIGFEATNLGGKWLHFENADTKGPCKAPKLQREFETTAGEFSSDWVQLYTDVGKEFCDLFCRDGWLLSRDQIGDFGGVPGNP